MDVEQTKKDKDNICSNSPQIRRKPKIVFNANNTEYDVVKKVSSEILGYELSYNDDEEWDIYWNDLALNTDLLPKMKPFQKINHFPGMMGLCKKNNLGRNINKMKKKFPKEYNFVPLTWLLPSEWNDLRSHVANNLINAFIVKPEGLSQGKGIYITTNIDCIDKTEHCVVQRYLSKPYLIDGLKFDLRIYVLVNGCDPLRIYIYKSGIARFCTDAYTAPSKANMNNLFMHLTNYAINKEATNFAFSESSQQANKGHKRSLESVWEHIDTHGGNSSALKEKIYECIVKTIISVQPSLTHFYRSSQPSDVKNDLCFEILGFDVIIDHRMKPYILEVNHAPSFNTDSPLDEQVKTALLTDTFRMLHMDYRNRNRYYRTLKNSMEARMYNAKHPTLNKEEKALLLAQNMKERDQYEKSVMGGYFLAYPAEVFT